MSETGHLDPAERLAALVDCMVICSRLAKSVGGATDAEVSLLAYLASLIRASHGDSTSSWGYEFATTSEGRPFSESLAATLDEMSRTGQLLQTEDGLVPSEHLSHLLRSLWGSESLASRISLVDAVCSITAVRGLPGIGRAVARDPQLSHAASLDAVRLLDQRVSSDDAISLAIKVLEEHGQDFPSGIPAIVWLDAWESRHDGR